MAPSASPNVCFQASDHLAQHERLQACLRVLHARGSQPQLMGLARHMAEQGLVRARGYDGAFARHLDLDVLREALSQMLREQWEEGYLIVRLLIEQREPELVARELEVSHAELLDMSRDALEDLGTYYEDVAFGALGQSAQEQAPGKARSAGKRR